MNVTVRGRPRPCRTVTFDAKRNAVLLIEQRLLPHLYNPMSKASNWTAWINNEQVYTTVTNAPAFQATSCRLGRGDSTISKYFVGEISEAMFFDRELTATERATMTTNYFNQRFDLW